MKATLECLVCFLQQAYRSAKLATSDVKLQRQIITEVASHLKNLDINRSPAELSMVIYEVTTRLSGNPDPYKEQKRLQNELALRLESDMRTLRDRSEDPLLTALRLSALGNVIDLGVLTTDEIQIDTILHQAEDIHFAVNHYDTFKEDLRYARQILFFLDNAGEIVFDKILIEELNKHAKITAVVKGAPIINDACMEDAIAVGLDKVCEVIAMEKGWIGAPWRLLEPTLLQQMEQADIIIGKGQGNYETLDDYPGNVYLLLKAKCPVVAQHMGVQQGDIGFISTKVQ